jgi:hypothetical protein
VTEAIEAIIVPRETKFIANPLVENYRYEDGACD